MLSRRFEIIELKIGIYGRREYREIMRLGRSTDVCLKQMLITVNDC